MKIIFVDDDTSLGRFVSTVLETDYKYNVHFQNTLTGFDAIVQAFEPDVIVLDVEIGEEDGIDKARDIVKKHPLIPILFVSSHTEEDFITRGIGTGANAYIPKPLSIPVLVSYIERFATNKQRVLEISKYQLKLVTNQVFYQKQLIKTLSPFEKSALELLMQHPNEVVSKEQFAAKLWGHSLQAQHTASLHNVLSRLRNLFKNNPSVKIRTIRGIGYKLHVNKH